jgi:FK506-binding nuclear protein
MAGIQIGGERKIQVPAAAAYGSKKQGDIPANSDLIFEVKCVGVN